MSGRPAADQNFVNSALHKASIAINTIPLQAISSQMLSIAAIAAGSVLLI